MMGMGCYIWYSEEGHWRLQPRPGPSSLYQMQQPTHQRPVYRLLYDGPLLCGFNYLHRSRELDASTQQSDGDIVTLANRGRTANAVNEYTHKYPTHVAWIITTSDHIGPHRTWTEHLELEITCLVGRIGSGVQVRASFQKNRPPHGSVRVKSRLYTG